MKYLAEMSWERLAFLVASAILIVLITSVTSCTISANNRAAELLKHGIPATEISCVISVGQDIESACSKAAHRGQ